MNAERQYSRPEGMPLAAQLDPGESLALQRIELEKTLGGLVSDKLLAEASGVPVDEVQLLMARGGEASELPFDTSEDIMPEVTNRHSPVDIFDTMPDFADELVDTLAIRAGLRLLFDAIPMRPTTRSILQAILTLEFGLDAKVFGERTVIQTDKGDRLLADLVVEAARLYGGGGSTQEQIASVLGMHRGNVSAIRTKWLLILRDVAREKQ